MVYGRRPEPPFDRKQRDPFSAAMDIIESSMQELNARVVNVESEVSAIKVQMAVLKVKVAAFVFVACTLFSASVGVWIPKLFS